ncbi:MULTISPECIES: DUF488 family protein [Shinella]|uniref:DUF488 domain-containing protein n=1 Tax=Shinella TaxID=323620 RepID=UPI001F57E1D8|nr:MULTISPECIES: DUF488 domain-containing protein [Shinella]MCW5710588.1 DUF488 domain-containing protein [Shinella sp.]
MVAVFTTIGHSNRPLEVFTAMLREAQVRLVVDVRAFPRSRTNPAYNIETLPAELAALQIGYAHIRALGGRKIRQREVQESVNAFWRERSFHNYADYALGDEFAEGLNELVVLGSTQRVAIMCSEAVWWRCHRRIITDYLLLSGHPVTHLLNPGHRDEARATPGARRTDDGKVIYPAEDDTRAVS